MVEPLLPIAPANTHCTACGAPLYCGYRAGETRCWCSDLPRLIPVPGEVTTGCLCETCLRAELARRTAATMPSLKSRL